MFAYYSQGHPFASRVRNRTPATSLNPLYAHVEADLSHYIIES